MASHNREPESIVALGPGAFGVPIDNDCLILLGLDLTGRTEDDTRTPDEFYATKYRAAFLNLAAGDEELLPTNQELREVRDRNPDRWKRLQDAATRLMTSHGLFPRTADPDILPEPMMLLSAEAMALPPQRTEPVSLPQDKILQVSA